MKYTPKSIETYLTYLDYLDAYRQEAIPLVHSANYDFELEHKLVEQCEAGDYIHAVESPIRDTE
jgi:hypothetical protein